LANTRSDARRLKLIQHPGLAVALAAAALLLLFSHPLVHGDGLAHFIYLDSIAGDGDLDLSNQAPPARFGDANTYHLFFHPVTGQVVTSFPFGSAYLLAPFYWLGRAAGPLAPAFQANGDYFHMRQGLPLNYSLAAVLGTQVYTVCAVWLAFQTARRFSSAGDAGLAALTCLAGTPLLFYATVEALSTHAIGAFVLALALWLATRPAEGEPIGPRRGGALGLLLGLAVLVRWQLLLYAAPAGLLLLWRALTTRDRRSIGAALAFALGLGVYAALCAAYFWSTFGSPLLIPTESQSGQAFLTVPLRHLPDVLLDSGHGWFTTSPAALLGLAGLLLLLRAPQRRLRLAALAALAGIALELALNASLRDWYGGWGFGQRRMSESYPALVLGAAWALGRARGRRLWRSAVLLCGGFGLVLMVAWLYYTHTSQHPEGASIAEVLTWLASGPHGPPLFDVLRDRYGPWAWAKPEL
jgi:hypothetical protein